MTSSSSLAPAFLLSMPQLVDPNFNRTVVLLCRHSEKDGAFGVVVNRPLMTTGRVTVNLDPPASTDRELQLWIGGPVEPQRSWILIGHEGDVDADVGTQITDNLFLSTSPDLLRRMLEPDPPPYARLIVGYSGWGPGQLEAELQASAWLMSDVDRDLIFNTPSERMWEAAIRRLGADPAALQISRGVH
jgi:putative transcriptional regulator